MCVVLSLVLMLVVYLEVCVVLSLVLTTGLLDYTVHSTMASGNKRWTTQCIA